MPSVAMPSSLATWLSYIESLHPKSISMGLDRVKQVIKCLDFKSNSLTNTQSNSNPTFPIITVAGTNGKGSTCAILEQIYKQSGYQVGCYTSPHLLRYNERVCVNGNEATDADLCAAFAAVEVARLKTATLHENGVAIQLTYFEVGTLAAIWHFMHADIDIAILEIGLGGRLDAVNAFEPNCAIVTSIDIDHQEFLGNTRESIGFEKAGVYRKSIPAICGDANPPASLVDYAKKIQADFKCIQRDFECISLGNAWEYKRQGKVIYTLPLPALQGSYQLRNAACAITAVETLQSTLPVNVNALTKAMHEVTLAGRLQTLTRKSAMHSESNVKAVIKSHIVILDVAHNPHAAFALAENLKASKLQKGKTFAVFAMLADKDIKGVIEALIGEIDVWYVAGIDNIRGASAVELASVLTSVKPNASYKAFDGASDAYLQACIDIEACIDSDENDKIIVFGSFFTVSNVMQLLSDGME